MLKLYKFNFNCGRMGNIESVFIADDEAVKNIIGNEVYFGEVLGKHSEIYVELKERQFTEKSDNQELIKELGRIFDGATISGLNPFKYAKIENDDGEKQEPEYVDPIDGKIKY